MKTRLALALLTVSPAAAAPLNFNGILLCPAQAADLSFTNGRVNVRSAWLAYIVTGQPSPGELLPARQPIRTVAARLGLSLTWQPATKTVRLDGGHGPPPEGSVEDAFALSFGVLSLRQTPPPEFQLRRQQGQLRVTYRGTMPLQGLFALGNATFRPFGDGRRSPHKLPSECQRQDGRTTCTVSLPENYHYLALRFGGPFSHY